MKILILEDEIPAAKKLETMLFKIDPTIKILDVCESVEHAIRWFERHASPDLIFMDIQLTDGISFEIFNQIEITSPIIFVTAFDNFAIDAFRVNSVDYILKPYSVEQLRAALEKYKNYFQTNQTKNNPQVYEQLGHLFQPTYKKRFFTKLNHSAYSVLTDDILFFVSEDNATVLVNKENKKFIINYSLDTLEKLLDPSVFFRINRKYIIHISSITKMEISLRNRIDIFFQKDNHELVSRVKTRSFKEWLDQ